MSKPINPIQLATIGAPHGVRGELRVKSFTGDPLALADYGPLYTADGRRFDVVDLRPAKNVVVVRFKQVTDRDTAESLNGEALFVDRSALPEDLDEGEYYHADLIGLAVFDDGGEIGKVAALHDFGGGDIIEVAMAGRRPVLVPFTAAAVPEVDIAGGRIRIDRTAAGLDDGGEAEAEPSPIDARPRGPRGAGGNR